MRERQPHVQRSGALRKTLPPKAPYACCACPSGGEDRLACGLPVECGVPLLGVPADGTAANAGLKKDDVIIACNGMNPGTSTMMGVIR